MVLAKEATYVSAAVEKKTFADQLPSNYFVSVKYRNGRNFISMVGSYGGAESLGVRLIRELNLHFQCDDLTMEGLDKHFEIESWTDDGNIRIFMK